MTAGRPGVEWPFWICVGLVVYVYVGYPLLLALLRVFFDNPVKKGPCEPSVSLLIPSYNEAAVIEKKIANSLALDYPPEKLEIVIASDGSKDSTVDLARACIERLGASARVRIFDYPANRGKIAVLNDSVPQLRGDVIVFSDASAMYEPDAIRELMANYADPRVGAAGGIYRIRETGSAQTGAQEEMYWRYESFIKVREAAMGSILGAHGTIHSLRKELYPFPPLGTINDDWVIPVRVLQRGYRVAYDPAAKTFEEAHEMTGFGRHVRIMAGNVQQLGELKRFLRPFRPRCVFYFLSHKALRLAVPFAMLAALALNLFLLDAWLYRATLAAQAVFYSLAILGAAWKLHPKILRLPYYFCRVNAAAFFGVYHAFTGRRRMAWS